MRQAASPARKERADKPTEFRFRQSAPDQVTYRCDLDTENWTMRPPPRAMNRRFFEKPMARKSERSLVANMPSDAERKTWDVNAEKWFAGERRVLPAFNALSRA